MNFRNTNIGKRFFIGLSVVFVLGISMILFFTLQLRQVSSLLDKDVPESIQNLKDTSHLDALAQFIRYYDEVLTQSARNYAFTSDIKWEARYNSVVPELDKIIKEAIEKGDEQDKAFFEEVDASNLALVDMEVKSLALVDAGYPAEAVAILESQAYADQKKIYEGGLRAYVFKRGENYNQTLEASTQILDKVNNSIRDIIQKDTLLMAILGGFALFVTAGVSLFIVRSVVVPLGELSDIAKVISQGDLSKRAAITSRDEIGQLAVSFNEMANVLQQSQQELEQEVEAKTTELSQAKLGLEGQQDALLNILEDVSEEKEFKEKESESLLEIIEEGIVITNKNGEITFINKSFGKTFGLKQEGASGRKFPDIFKAYDLKNKPLDQKMLGDDQIGLKDELSKKLVLESNSGSKIAVIIGSSKIFVDNEFRGVIRVIHDFSSDLKLQKQKDDFFSIASHELRTPLTVISGNLDNILQGYGGSKLTETDNALVKDVMDASDRLIRMVEDFLNVSRLDQGRVKMEIKEMDFCSLTAKIVEEMTPIVSKKGLKLEFISHSKDHCGILADEDKLREIIVNLIGNSLKFTKTGGITIEHSVDGNALSVKVRDTGMGIAKDKQNLLFQRFQQAMDRTLAREAGGTGLGLYISREFARLMGGELKLLESDIGKGSTFELKIPLATQVAKESVKK